jgi:hypothetical protein
LFDEKHSCGKSFWPIGPLAHIQRQLVQNFSGYVLLANVHQPQNQFDHFLIKANVLFEIAADLLCNNNKS